MCRICEEMVGEWVSPQEWRGIPPTVGFGHKGSYNLGNGEYLYGIETAKIFYDFGVVVLNLLVPLVGGFSE